MNEFVKQVSEFQKTFDPKNLSVDKNRLESMRYPDNVKLLKLRLALIQEEVHELDLAMSGLFSRIDFARHVGKSLKHQLKHCPADYELWQSYKTDVADALGDILVVTIGTALALGLNIEEIMRRIHKSNMSKLGENGKPIYRADGKVMKGPNYFPPELDDLV